MATKPPTKTEKDKQVISTVQEFYKKIARDDKNAILDLNSETPIEFIPTGSWVINSLIGDGTMTGKPGGFPRGHITEIFGDESSGKTTLLLSGIREAQNLGHLCFLFDFEQTYHKGYAAKLGVSSNENKLVVFQPKHFQQGARLIKDAFSMKPGLVAIDSVAAMTPRQYLEGEIDELGRVGLLAQLMSSFLTIITKDLKESNTALVMTNQLRTVINMNSYGKNYGPSEESTGGKALKYYVSLRIRMMKGTIEKIERISRITGKTEKEPVNVTTRVAIVKNKIDKPHFSAPVFIRFGEGFDNIQSIIELAVNTGVIKRAGAFFTFRHGDEQLIKVQGKIELWKALNESEKLFKILQSSLVFKEDEEVQAAYAEDDPDVPRDAMDDALENVALTFIQKTQAKAAKATVAAADPKDDE